MTRVDGRVPYLVLAAVLLVLLGVQTLNRQWSSDFFMHTATINALRDDIVDPEHDMTGTDDPSERSNPYMVGLAEVGRVSGLATVTVLQLAGLVNLVAFLVAFELFVTGVVGRRGVAFYALLATLFLWGLGPWRWSGYLNLNSIGFGLPWPSMFATAVVLLVGWAALRYDVSGSYRWLFVIGVGLTLTALSHPYTFLWGLVMLAALGFHRRLYRRGRVEGLVVAALGTVALVAAWPYYPFFELTSVDGDYSKVMQAMYTDVPARTVSALPGFVLTGLRFRRDRRDPVALMLLGGLVIYVAGALADTQSLGRVLPLIMLAAHIAIGAYVADVVSRRTAAPWPVLAGLAVAAVVGVIGVAPAFPRLVPRGLLPTSVREKAALLPSDERYPELDGALAPGTVVVAPPDLAGFPTAYHYVVVAPGYPAPFVDDLAARRVDAATFLDESTPAAARATIEQRYDVGAVMCGSAACTRTFADGEVVASGRDWTLIRLPSP